MAALVETMMYVREKPWHGLGTMVAEAPTSEDALRLAGLDWQVEQRPVFTDDGMKIPGYKANVRDSDKKVLGIVGDRYQVVQNTEAFAFTDALVGETENGVVTYETAGSLRGGKTIWLLAKMPTQKILGDDIEPYLCFTNSHDGSGALRVCMSPIRVVCQNTLNLALSSATRQWNTRHTGDLRYKLEEAKECLGLANTYMAGLDQFAETLADKKLYREQLDEILAEMYPVNEKDSEIKKRNVERLKKEFMIAYHMPDLVQFRDTAWGAVNAIADAVGHAPPSRKTENYAENRWGRIMVGHEMVDRFVKLVQAKVGVR